MYYIIMEEERKLLLKNYFDFTSIRAVRDEMGLDTTAETWEALWQTYRGLTTPKEKRKRRRKIKIATAEQRRKLQKKRDKKKREKAFTTIKNYFSRYLQRRRTRVRTQSSLEGAVRQRTITPERTIPFTNNNIVPLSNYVMTNISYPLAPQHILVSFRFFVIFDDGTIMYQNRRIFEANYTRGNRQEFIARLRNAINENLGIGFGNTKGYDAFVISIRLVITNRDDLIGGCAGRNCKDGKQVKIGGKNNYWKTFNPKGDEKSNNCLFKCLGLDTKTINKLRDDLQLGKGTKIKIDKIPEICDYLGVGIRVYDGMKRELLYYGHKYENEYELVLLQEHYLLITDKLNKCEDCGKLWLKQHTCNTKRKQFWAFKNGDKVVKPSTKKVRTEPIDYSQIIYYDFETFTPNNQFEVYAAGYYDPITQQAERFYGKESLTDFVKYMSKQEGKIFIAHNGARFDCYFLVNEMLKQNIPVKDIILNNGAIMTYKFGNENKLLDSCCFISSKLGDAGKSFKIPQQYWKSEFNHKRIQNWNDTIRYKKEVVKYLDLDIYCLKYVWEAFSDKIFNNFQIHTTDFITTSSMTYALWTNWNQSVIYIPSEDELEFIQRSTYGANVYPVKKHFKSKEYNEIIKGTKKYDDLTDYLMIMDVVSLYPTSMLNEYPTGKASWVADIQPNKMGIYEIDFKPPKDILFSQLPRKVNGGIIHSLENGTGVYNSIDIARAIDAGYEITKVHKGLVWENKEEVFGEYIRDVFKMKCKAKEDDDDVMYAISKLLLNGLYGKTLQRPIFQKTEIINNHKDAVSFLNKHESINDIELLTDDYVLYSGELEPDDKEDAITKPTQLGSFVLGYSRTIMYDIIKCIDPTLKSPCFYYTDTDCLHIHQKDMPKVEHLLGDELGLMNSDLKNEGRIIEGIYLAPKQYSVCYIGNDNKVVGKYKCKGIDRKYLKEGMYKKAVYKGEGTDVKMTDRFKKIHYKRNNNQQDYSQFSVHLEDINRTFHKTKWEGRTFLGNNSFPLGHPTPLKAVLSQTGIPPEIANLIIEKIK